MDPHGHVRKALGPTYAHKYHVEDFWADCKDDKEVRMRHYMRMTVQFLRRVQLFPVPDQVEEDESTLVHPRYPAVADLAIPSINWDEQEVKDLDTITQPIIARTKEWVDGQVAQLKQRGVALTYEALKSRPSATEDVATSTSAGETSKSPPVTRSQKRKEAEIAQSVDPTVQATKDMGGSSPKKLKRAVITTEAQPPLLLPPPTGVLPTS